MENLGSRASGHARWVRISHGLGAASVLALALSGFVILMAHPRLYWGDAGNDLTPPLFELPISRNHAHGGWSSATAFFAGGPVSANRTYDIFNENGWARSLHFLAGWGLVSIGAFYLARGIASAHFRSNIVPRVGELTPRSVWRDVLAHVGPRASPSGPGPTYGIVQKCAYTLVIFVCAPLLVVSGLAMSPAVTAAVPALLQVFGGFQSARTVHFFAFAALLSFVVVHVAMVIRSGFKRQLRAMTVGK